MAQFCLLNPPEHTWSRPNGAGQKGERRMNWNTCKGDPYQHAADLLVVTVHADDEHPRRAGLPPAMQKALQNQDTEVFTAKKGSWLLWPGEDMQAPWLLLVGLGAEAEVSLDAIRRAAGVAAGQARKIKAGRCVWDVASGLATGFDPRTLARCWVEGATLALSPAGKITGKNAGADQDDEKYPREWTLLTRDGRQLRQLKKGIAEGEAYGAGCLFARRLVNLPGNYLTPRLLASEARKMARKEGFRCRVMGPAQLRTASMGGLLGVGQGSREEPRLIVLDSPAPARTARRRRRKVALVGKGITFDSGGISIKPSAKMDQMKYDMAGAAAVLGAAQIIARLELPVDLQVVVPAAENLPGGSAIKPGDVLTMAAGKTVEVLNTDAEGRLVLADGLHYAGLRDPDYIIDAATLTGACVVALGKHFAGLMSTSAELIEVITQAGGETFERAWHLPVIEAHHESLQSQVADLKNLGFREAGALTAAAFLAEFVPPEIPWAHLDIAGPVWTEKAGPLGPKGATGYGARLLARTVEILVT
jgi:leucyl aminopeptidase